MRLSLLTLLLLMIGCSVKTKLGEKWWHKKPSEEEQAFFNWALNAPQAPSDQPSAGDFVGWYGILKECRELKVQPPRALLTLDHRYADQTNVYRGIGDHLSIQTVSLFGEGEYVATAKSCANLWPGDLVRTYGDLRRKEAPGRWTLETIYVRSWQRHEYELAPLRAGERTPEGKLARMDGWPKLKLDTSVESAGTSIDPPIKKWLIQKLKDPNEKERAANALAEYGGKDSVAALEAAGATKKQMERARRAIGPSWRPGAGDPYWQSPGDEPEFYKMQNWRP